MENLFSFLFFLLLMGLNIYVQSNKKKKKRKRDFPIDFPHEEPPVQRRDRTDKRTLDYMMAKPEDKPQPPQAKRKEAPKIQESRPQQQSSYNEFSRRYQEYAANKNVRKSRERNSFRQPVDFIQQGEIKSDEKERKMQISIEKRQIMQAITYAQVLEQPKSLRYLRRFGIKRIEHKD